ncbi:MAG: DUF4160 domain-containing protein, partial [Candidatus Rokubacteria bacterium]|nr:DUF4160 domain-containing protein [Candidatus Rokubacteria bacterium]
MRTIPRIKNVSGPYRFFFYSFDCSEPKHVHVQGGVPIRVEIEKWRILPVGCSTTNRPSGK